GDAAVSALEGFVNELALPEVDAERFELVAGAAGVAQAEVVGQDDVAFAHDDGAVDHVAELPHVAGPGIAEDLFASIWREDEAGPAVLALEVVEKVQDKELDVGAAVAQRGNVELKDGEAV